MTGALARHLLAAFAVLAVSILATGCDGGDGGGDGGDDGLPPSSGTMLVSEVVLKSRGTFPSSASCGLPSDRRLFCYQEAVPVATGGGNPYDWNGGWTSECAREHLSDPSSPNTGLVTRTNAERFTTRQNAYVEQRLDAPAASAVPHSIGRLDRITSVSSVLLSGGAFGRSGERSFEVAEASIRSRENEAYRQAIMCGQRMEWN